MLDMERLGITWLLNSHGNPKVKGKAPGRKTYHHNVEVLHGSIRPISSFRNLREIDSRNKIQRVLDSQGGVDSSPEIKVRQSVIEKSTVLLPSH